MKDDTDDTPEFDAGERKRVLDELGVMTEDELALLYDCGIKAMRNRPKSDTPPFFRAGHQRLWFRQDVIEFFRRRTID